MVQKINLATTVHGGDHASVPEDGPWVVCCSLVRESIFVHSAIRWRPGSVFEILWEDVLEETSSHPVSLRSQLLLRGVSKLLLRSLFIDEELEIWRS